MVVLFKSKCDINSINMTEQIHDPNRSKHDQEIDVALNIDRARRSAERSAQDQDDTKKAVEAAKRLRGDIEESNTAKTGRITTKRLVTGVAIGGVLTAGAIANDQEVGPFASEHLTEVTISVPEGGTIINSVEEAVDVYLQTQGLSLKEVSVSNLVAESQAASKTYKEHFGTTVIPANAQFDVELNKSAMGDYSVEVEPLGVETTDDTVTS